MNEKQEINSLTGINPDILNMYQVLLFNFFAGGSRRILYDMENSSDDVINLLSTFHRGGTEVVREYVLQFHLQKYRGNLNPQNSDRIRELDNLAAATNKILAGDSWVAYDLITIVQKAARLAEGRQIDTSELIMAFYNPNFKMLPELGNK